MTGALVGITLIQYYWIKWQVDLNEENFDSKVTMTLNRVKEQIEKEASLKKDVKSDLDKITKSPFGTKSTIGAKQYLGNMGSFSSLDRSLFDDTYAYLKPQDDFDNISNRTLDRLMLRELQDQSIDLDYNYGVYSNGDKGFFIVDGEYVPLVNEDEKSSESGINNSLSRSEYQIDLFRTEIANPGFLKIFFPKKNSFLWSQVSTSLLTSLIFTGLILFCFSYTIMVILRQKKVSEMKTDFINNMTHEFKTPIATISLASDSITSPMIINDESKIRRFTGIIKQENQRMLKQVEKVLQMATIDKQDFDLKLATIDMHDIITKASGNANLKVEQKDGSISLDLSAESPEIIGDETHLTSIIHNLLDNAMKYSKNPPKIVVSTRNVRKGLEVSVKDNGIGISSESIKHIFDKFYRVHTGNLHDVKGFGLGLSYVKAIVDAHKATIKVQSELGKGSNFIINFPVDKSDLMTKVTSQL